MRVVGQYKGGSTRFADEEFTFSVGNHPSGNLLGPAAYGARVAARRRFTHHIASDSSTGTRVAAYGGMFPEREFFRYRTDLRGLTSKPRFESQPAGAISRSWKGRSSRCAFR
jgi:hypothetical protein